MAKKTKVSLLSALSFFFGFLFESQSGVQCETQQLSGLDHAGTPPRGWNSYDSFCWTISEEEFLENAELVAQRLHVHGYEYVVVDYLWYRRKVPGASVDSLGYDVIDEWGRVIPDPERWPSSRGGNGFSEVAKRVHDLGLKFGIHVMRGISKQAFNANTPILDTATGKAYEESGRKWYAKDIGVSERACAWMRNGFMSVDTKSGAGRAFLRSLYEQYAEWNVDFVKHDCVFGDDFDINEISVVSEVLKELNRPILYSLSPGTSVTPAMAKDVAPLVNMYRITGDDWDQWGDVLAHFDVSSKMAANNLIGAKGLLGTSWPDLDMLPLGWLTDAGSNEGPHRASNLSPTEQKTQMTLWSIAKSPLMFGGDMRKLDDATFSLLTNPVLLELNSFSSNNMEFPYITDANGNPFKSRDVEYKTRSLLHSTSSEELVLRLTSCEDGWANGWFAKALDNEREQICWEENSRSTNGDPFCLHKSKVLLDSDEEVMNEHRDSGMLHLRATDVGGFCFGASSKRRLKSEELNRGSFSPCRWDSNQMWQFKNGTLVNSYSGLCASMRQANRVNAGPGGIRSWIATGRRGEVYLAFFNLTPETTVVSATVPDLAKAVQRNFSSCLCTETWSGKDFQTVTQSISTPVESHGSVLFVLFCL